MGAGWGDVGIWLPPWRRTTALLWSSLGRPTAMAIHGVVSKMGQGLPMREMKAGHPPAVPLHPLKRVSRTLSPESQKPFQSGRAPV